MVNPFKTNLVNITAQSKLSSIRIRTKITAQIWIQKSKINTGYGTSRVRIRDAVPGTKQ